MPRGTARGSSRGSANSSTKRQKSSKTLKISKYFKTSDESDSTGDRAKVFTPYKKLFNKPTKNEHVDTPTITISSDEDFEPNQKQPPVRIAKIFDMANVKRETKPAARRTRKRNTTTKSTSKSLQKFTMDNFTNGDVDSNQLQLALALSKSEMQDADEDVHIPELPPKCTSNLTLKETLQKFGFRSNHTSTSLARTTSHEMKRKKKSKFQHVTPALFTRKETERSQLISAKVAKIVRSSLPKFCVLNRPEITLECQELKDITCINSHFYKLSQSELFEIDFYANGLNIPHDYCKAGFLLKSWGEIIGRDKSPEREQLTGNELTALGTMTEINADKNICFNNLKESALHSLQMSTASFTEETNNVKRKSTEVIDKFNSSNISNADNLSSDEHCLKSLNESSLQSLEISTALLNTCSVTDTNAEFFEQLMCSNISHEEHMSEQKCFKILNEPELSYLEISTASLTTVESNTVKRKSSEVIDTLNKNNLSSDEHTLKSLNESSLHSLEKSRALLSTCFSATGNNTEGFEPLNNSNASNEEVKCFKILNESSLLSLELSTALLNSNLDNDRKQTKDAHQIIEDTTESHAAAQIATIEEPPGSPDLFLSDDDSDNDDGNGNIVLNNQICVTANFGEDAMLKEMRINQHLPDESKLNISLHENNFKTFEKPSVFINNLLSASILSNLNTPNIANDSVGMLLQEHQDLMTPAISKNVSQNNDSVHWSRHSSIMSTSSVQSQESIVISDEELNYAAEQSLLRMNTSTLVADNSPQKSVPENVAVIEIGEDSFAPLKRSALNFDDTSNDSFDNLFNDTKIAKTIDIHAGNESVITATPDNNGLIIKTDGVTPVPHYSDMDTPKIAGELKKFGVKPMKRKKGVQLLKYLYDATHPEIGCSESERHDSSSSDEDGSADLIAKKRHKTGRIVYQRDVGTEAVPSRKDAMRDYEETLLIFETRKSVKIASCVLPFHIAWHNFMVDNPELRQKILFYEPIELELVYKMFRLQGFKYNIKDMLAFFDKKCIAVNIKKVYQKRLTKQLGCGSQS